MQTYPDLLRILNQDVISGRVVLAIKIGGFDQVAKQHICLQPHFFRHSKHDAYEVLYRRAKRVDDFEAWRLLALLRFQPGLLNELL